MRHRKLLEKITHRGPQAYQKFLKILNVSFPDAHSILEKKYSGLDRSLRLCKFEPGSPCDTRPPQQVELSAATIPLPQVETVVQLQNAGTEVIIPNRIIPALSYDKCQPIDVGGGLKLEYYTKEITPKRNIAVKLADKFHTSGKISTYDMKSSKRGILFLVNIIKFDKHPEKTRNGATVDRDNLISLFRQMHFEVMYYEDITKAVRNR